MRVSIDISHKWQQVMFNLQPQVNHMTIINPEIYTQADDHRAWNDLFPAWLATTQEVPAGTWMVPAHRTAVMLTNDGQLGCVSNICTHKRALIGSGKGKLGSVITCPIHKWSWNTDGKIKGARGFGKDCGYKMDLPVQSLHTWNGHVFMGPSDWQDDIGKLGNLSRYLHADLYSWHSRQQLVYAFDWKIFMEIFLDLYHVRSFHPGLSSLTDCSSFDWQFGQNWSCQTGAFNRGMIRDPAYDELYALYKQTGHYDTAEYGAIWLGIYPNTMIEYYPGCLVVSTVWPSGAGRCVNYLDFYYENGLLEKHPDFADIQQKCFMVTADEDEVIGLRMQEGLSLTTEPFLSMNHPIEEAGYAHLHAWLQANLGT